jgi:hypothetical protein
MKATITSVNNAPPELRGRAPFAVYLIRQMPGPDRSDYWLCRLERPIVWWQQREKQKVTHVILAVNDQTAKIEDGIQSHPVSLAYITDDSEVDAQTIDFSKCKYISTATVTVYREPESGRIDLRLSLFHVVCVICIQICYFFSFNLSETNLSLRCSRRLSAPLLALLASRSRTAGAGPYLLFGLPFFAC